MKSLSSVLTSIHLFFILWKRNRQKLQDPELSQTCLVKAIKAFNWSCELDFPTTFINWRWPYLHLHRPSWMAASVLTFRSTDDVIRKSVCNSLRLFTTERWTNVSDHPVLQFSRSFWDTLGIHSLNATWNPKNCSSQNAVTGYDDVTWQDFAVMMLSSSFIVPAFSALSHHLLQCLFFVKDISLFLNVQLDNCV